MSKNKVPIIITSIIVGYITNRGMHIYNCVDGSKIKKLSITLNTIIERIKERPFYLDTEKNSILASLISILIVIMIYLYKLYERKNFMVGEEHGDAKWGKLSEIRKLKDSDYFKNNIISKNIRLSMDMRVTNKNNHVLINGSSGTRKTRGYVKPNIMQMLGSYIVIDPKGTVITEVGGLLKKGKTRFILKEKYKKNKIINYFINKTPLNKLKIIKNKFVEKEENYDGYNIKIFNTLDFKQSMHFNPFHYIKEERDILSFVNNFMMNTKGEGDNTGQDFWIKAEINGFCALIGYMWYMLPKNEHNFKTLVKLHDLMTVNSDKPDEKSIIDILFDEMAEQYKEDSPQYFAVRQYNKLKKGAGDTLKGILISMGVRLAPFDIKDVRDITEYDELEIETYGHRKTALFVIIDDDDTTFNFLVSLLYSTVMKVLKNKADLDCNGWLPLPVRIIADEWANTCKIPNFEKLLPSIRSRNISMSIMVQNIGQIKALYKDHANTIIENCSTYLFLGTTGEETAKSISDRTDRTTVDYRSSTVNKGMNGGFSISEQVMGRNLITLNGVLTLKDDECLVFISGLNPYKEKKYDIKHHPNYKYVYDGEKSKDNIYDLKKELSIMRDKKYFLNNVDKIEECKVDIKDKELENDKSLANELNQLIIKGEKKIEN